MYLEVAVDKWSISDLLNLVSPCSVFVTALHVDFLINCSNCYSEYTSFNCFVLTFAVFLKSQVVLPT